MKAVLALIIIYVGTFLVAIQGASQNPVQAAQQSSAGANAHTKAVDPAKEADIRSLLELLGVRDAIQEVTSKSLDQYRENLLATVSDSERGRNFVTAFTAGYSSKFNVDDVTDQLVLVYDKHFTEDEIKGLLQFYGSPLGQRYAEEMPKVNSEAQAAGRALSLSIARDVLQDLRKQYPGFGAQARITKPHTGQQAQLKQQAQNQPESAQP